LDPIEKWKMVKSDAKMKRHGDASVFSVINHKRRRNMLLLDPLHFRFLKHL